MNIKTLYILAVLLFFIACKKELGTKPDKSLFVPNTLTDLQALMDNDGIFIINQPALGELGADDYYLESDVLSSLYVVERNAYLWLSDVYEGEIFITDWDAPYQQILYANTVLQAAADIAVNASSIDEWNNVEGSALFCRAFAFYNLAQLFAKPYDAETAENDLGIPLRLTADFNVSVSRSTIKQTYEQITGDLRKASALLPVSPLGKTRPSKPAAFAMLARTYFAMGDYDSAYLYADSCLQLYHTLIDYNTIDTSADYSFPLYSNDNSEIIYQGVLTGYSSVEDYGFVDSVLYASYAQDDLRQRVFFAHRNGGIMYKGSYWGSSSLFGGVAVDEIYLMRAECNARRNNITAAMDDLNTLMRMRWLRGNFNPFTASNADEALKIILSERRKELLMRGLRWTDLRRLNKDERYAATLTRLQNGTAYTLPPNDDRYVYPIPNDELLYNDIPQNPR